MDSPPAKSWSIHTRPEIITKYQILERVGSGAYSDVYRARRLSDDLTVALKEVHDYQSAFREIEALQTLQACPNVVVLHEYFWREDEDAVLVLEFLASDFSLLSVVFQRKSRTPIDLPDLQQSLSLISRSRSHHTSLIKLLGASLSGSYVYLVYEFIDGANLADCLRNPTNPSFTVLSSWLSRLQIATDLAHGYKRMSLIEKAREAVKCGGGVRRWVDRRLKDSFPMEVAEKMVQVEKKSFMSSISNSHDPHVFINDGAVTENDDRYDVGTKIQVQGRLEPGQAYLKQSKRGLGADAPNKRSLQVSENESSGMSEKNINGKNWVQDEEMTASSSSTTINSSNIGFQLLKKHGWKEGTGLGISEQGSLEPIQTYLKNNKRGLGADKVQKVLKPPDPSPLNEKSGQELHKKKSKGLSKKMKKMQELESRLQEKEFERAFFREFWPDNV
ncbi:hypothetical protein ACLB2K_043377 [Fragaria x ananassa]